MRVCAQLGEVGSCGGTGRLSSPTPLSVWWAVLCGARHWLLADAGQAPMRTKWVATIKDRNTRGSLHRPAGRGTCCSVVARGHPPHSHWASYMRYASCCTGRGALLSIPCTHAGDARTQAELHSRAQALGVVAQLYAASVLRHLSQQIMPPPAPDLICIQGACAHLLPPGTGQLLWPARRLVCSP
jgi:hypothetical protein